MKRSVLLVTTALLLVSTAHGQPRIKRPSTPIQPQATQFTLGNLEFKGNKRTRGSLLRWLIPLNPGDIFDQSKWEVGLRQIEQLGLFEPIVPADVVFNFDYVKGIVHVELNLRERDRQRIELSGGGGTTGGFTVGLDYSNMNLRGVADRLHVRSEIGNRERSFAGAYSTTVLARTPVTLNLAGYFQRRRYVDARIEPDQNQSLFVERTVGANFGLHFPISRSPYKFAAPTRLGFLYSFSSTDVTDALTEPVGGADDLTQGRIRIGSVTTTLTHNTLDRPFDPSRGQSLELANETGARVVGGSLNIIKPSIDYRRFFPLGASNSFQEGPSLGFRIRAGHVASFGERLQQEALVSVGGVPIFRRFFAGGDTQVRGYDINSIAPLARVDRILLKGADPPVTISSEIRPIGADSRMLINVEYRVPIIWRLSAASFVDFGAACNLNRLKEERIETTTRIEPLETPATVVTVLRPLDNMDPGLPCYRVSLGGELRFQMPLFNIPVRFIVAVNPNAQRRVPNSTLIAPEKRITYGFGFGRTL